MAFGDSSSPARFGYGQSGSDDRNLFMKVFGGEVYSAFSEKVVTLDKHQTKAVTHGKSWSFPKTWKATSEYHTAGQEMLGNDIDTTEITITVDGKLVSHVGIYDLDAKMSHFDVTSQFSKELGSALARTYDKNVMRSIIQTSRLSADGPFPGGTVISDASLTNSGAIDGKAWIDAIRAAKIALFEKDVPDDQTFYMVVNAAVFDAIKYAKDASGQYLLIDRNFHDLTIKNRAETIVIEDVQILRSRLIPSTNETADTSVYTKYRADYSKVKAILWTPMAVATVHLQSVALESTRDVRRQEDFMVASMAAGTGGIRPECAVSFVTP